MANLSGDEFDNEIIGTGQDDTIRGRAGNDTLVGRGGDDSIRGADGDDDLEGGRGNDTLIGGAGDDFLRGGRGRDVFDGSKAPQESDGLESDQVTYQSETGSRGVTVNLATGRARDTYGDRDRLIDIEMVRGSQNDDRLTGGNPNNDSFESFRGLAGNDTINGGSGFDDLRFDRDANFGGNAAVTVNFITGRATDGFGDTDRFSNIERVTGTNKGDTFIGNEDDNQFRGLGGNDTIDGGEGIDRVDYSRDAANGGNRGIRADLKEGRVRDSFGDTDRVQDIENVRGTDRNDNVFGDREDNNIVTRDGNDSLDGRGGDDSLSGENGKDTIDGGAGDDFLSGGSGRDRLNGENGNDFLLGGLGKDTLNGGNGFDTFAYDRIEEGDDRINAFNAAQDRFGFKADAFGFNQGDTFVLDVNFFISDVRGAAQGDGPAFVFEDDADRLWYDADGSGNQKPELIAILGGDPTLEEGNFFFY